MIIPGKIYQVQYNIKSTCHRDYIFAYGFWYNNNNVFKEKDFFKK